MGGEPFFLSIFDTADNIRQQVWRAGTAGRGNAWTGRMRKAAVERKVELIFRKGKDGQK